MSRVLGYANGRIRDTQVEHTRKKSGQHKTERKRQRGKRNTAKSIKISLSSSRSRCAVRSVVLRSSPVRIIVA